MSNGPSRSGQSAPFSRRGVLALVVVGFLAFLAMAYFIGAGDTGEDTGDGAAHAASNGVNGYAGLVRLLEAEGFDVDRSRSVEDHRTYDLLVLTPPLFADADDISRILRERESYGPTLVILPKWMAIRADRVTEDVAEEFEDRIRDGWVKLGAPTPRAWTAELDAPYTFEHKIELNEPGSENRWAGAGASGDLASPAVTYADPIDGFYPIATNGPDRVLAMQVEGAPGSTYREEAHWAVFVTEPDLMNNLGLADSRRAAAALQIVREAGYGDSNRIVFDLTLNGFGSSMNLLTLAFQPPFLAATLCLILAMIIIGWRAFLRFGPSAVAAQDIAFGKERLVSNGAGLIVRARRLGLLGKPYARLVERRLAAMLGLRRHDAQAIDHALAVRLPGHEPFSVLAERLQNARKPTEILRAARALNELTRKLAK